MDGDFSSAAALRFQVMRIVLPRTRYWEGLEERAERRDEIAQVRRTRCHAGTREMIAGPVRWAEHTDAIERVVREEERKLKKKGEKRKKEKQNRKKICHTWPCEPTQAKLKTPKILTYENESDLATCNSLKTWRVLSNSHNGKWKKKRAGT